VHASDSVVHCPNTRACDALGDVAHHLGSEPVVAEEDVADAGYQYLGRNLTPVRYIRRIFM
jgi:hydroxyacyl-ACP dehydratase HTD2-like protein with hotdog domain